MRSPRRWHTRNGYHPSPQQRYFGAQKPKKRAKVLLFFGLTKFFFDFYIFCINFNKITTPYRKSFTKTPSFSRTKEGI